MRSRSPIAAALIVVFAATLGSVRAGHAADPVGDPVVARVDGAELHRSDVEAARQTLPAEAQNLPFEQLYPVLLDRLVNSTLIIDAGRKEHLDQGPEYQQKLRLAEDRLVQEAYIGRLLRDADNEDQLKSRYDVWIKDHPGQEEVHARHILVGNEDEAKAIIAQLDKGEDFATLAKAHSTDPGAASGGDLGYFGRDDMVPEFAEAAFSIPIGQYGKTPVHTKFGWHVIKVEDRRMGKPPSFDEARPELRQEIARGILEAKLKELHAAAKVETFGPDGGPLPKGK
jgi:peptidyl-prolyl cis-trans isomerase C